MSCMKRRKINFLKNVPLSRKMLIIYISCVILPIIVLSVFYYNISVSGIQSRERKDLESAVSKAGNAVQMVMDKTVLVRELILCDDEIYDILSISEGDGKSVMGAVNALGNKVMPYQVNDFLQSLIIYSKNSYLYSSNVHRKISELEEMGWLDKYKVDRTSIALFLNYDKIEERSSIVMLSALNSTPTSDRNILRIDLPVSVLARELSKNYIGSSIYLLDEKNRVIATGVGENSAPEYKDGDIICLDGSDMIARELDYPRDYKVVARYCPNKSDYVFEAQTIQFILVVMLILLISTVVIYLVTKSLTDKLNVLTACTVKIQEGIFDPVDEGDAGRDEIGILFHGINEAIAKINSLINEVYAQKLKNAEMEKSRYKMELTALQARVNPHFMFNVFEVMRMKVIKRGDRELASVIKEISKIFRMLITWNDDIITIEEEMKFVTAFLNIQPYSIDDDEIGISVSVAEDAKECLVPKMSVQVFVENAFLHGLENISENRRFSLEVHTEEDRLIIEICDNGCGFDSETLDAVRRGELISGKLGGTGIKNVMSRLKHYYDGDYSVEITSVPYEETRVRLDLPVRRTGAEPDKKPSSF